MKDSVFKTIAVTIAVCFVCSVLVATSAVVLKPYQERNKQIDKKRNILVAAGLLEPKGPSVTQDKIDELFEAQIKAVVLDLETGEIVTDAEPSKIDEKAEMKDENQSTAIPSSEDIAGIGRKPNLAVIYQVEKDGKLDRIIFPIVGKGLWSTMYGFAVLRSDYNTIATVLFYDHGETAGLGGEISNPKWQAHWEDKLLYNDKGEMVRVIRGSVDPSNPRADIQVDGIGGSTLTGNGVTNTVHYWLGANGFGPYIEKQKESLERE